MKSSRSFPSEWRTHTLIWRNKPDLDTLSMDDLYNNLKIYEAEVIRTTSSSHNTQNIAFVSFHNTDNTNNTVSTAHGVCSANSKTNASNLPNVYSLSDAMIYSFFASQLGYDWSDHAEEEPTNFALMAYTSSNSSSSSNSDTKILKLDVRFRDNALAQLRKKFEQAEKERDDLKLKLEKFEESSKNLTKLLNSQIDAKDKSGGVCWHEGSWIIWRRYVGIKVFVELLLLRHVVYVGMKVLGLYGGGMLGLKSLWSYCCSGVESFEKLDISFLSIKIVKMCLIKDMGSKGAFWFSTNTTRKMRIEQYCLMTDYALWESAKSLMKAIKKRFGGNKESKKVQKTLLKQQYENFNGTSSEGLNQIYDRLQNLINLDTLSMDDLYNNLKIYEAEVIRTTSSSHNTQNIAFVSFHNTDNTNNTVSAAHGVCSANSKTNASNLPNVDSLSDAMIYSFFASQSSSP
nr:ribonuclease H-like domain-containing protein [Tanacetum cinerariifolium]